MTKEEQLKEEAENKLDEWSDPDMGCEEGYCYSEVADFMFRFAEPREKKISELEERCNTLDESLSAENEKLKCQIKTAYRKGLRHFAKALKDYDRTDGAWTDYFEHTVDEVLQKEQEKLEGLGTTEDQLAKAKHYIKELARAVEHSYSVLSWQRPPIKAEAEQFLKEVEI